MSDETTPRPLEGNPSERDLPTEPRGVLPIGTPRFFGRYETWRVLGSGAFGRVYLARDPEMTRYVAIKAPKDPLPPDTHRAFLREARMVADIHHPNICPVHDIGVQDELPYIVMRYVGGGTLADLVARGLPTPTQALQFAEQIANGLERAHARGIIHRDLKPANVLYDEEARELLLTDFGVARWADATHTIGGNPGTPIYMAPEQWGPGGAFGDISARTDVYCLGVILFQLLTGSRLFPGTGYALMTHHCQTPPSAPSTVRPDLGPRFDDLCLKALAKKQDERFGSAGEFKNAIAECLRTPQTRWRITVPGRWSSRPVADTEAKWQKVTITPAEVTTRRGEVYRLRVDIGAEDDVLAGVAHHLKSLTALQHLDLALCGVTDAGVAHLKGLTALQHLNLSFCKRLTDAGVTHLKGLTALQTLELSGCDQVTDAGVAALKRALPNCKIRR